MNPAQQRAFLENLGMVDPEPEQEQQEVDPAAPDFDGGPRQTAPLPSDPETDHNKTLLDLLDNHREAPSGGGEDW